MKSCPFCYKPVPDEGQMCIHCGSEFPGTTLYRFSVPPRSFATGICKVALLIQGILLCLEIIRYFDLQRISLLAPIPAVFTTLATIICLLHVYHRQPLAADKIELVQQQKVLSRLIQHERTLLDTILSTRNSIETNHQSALEERKKVYQQMISRLDDDWREIVKKENIESDYNLRLSQQIHMREGLELASLKNVNFFDTNGDLLRTILDENGISNAAQMKQHRLDTIADLDESSIQELLKWQQDVERSLLSTQPTSLARKSLIKIKEKYTPRKKSVLKHKNIAFSSYKKEMAQINRDAIRLHIENDGNECEIKERLEMHAGKLKPLLFKLEQMRHINFRNFLSATFDASRMGMPAKTFGRFLILMLFILPSLRLAAGIISSIAFSH